MTKKQWHKETLAVRGGLERSSYQETSEALYLNSGYVYDTAEEAAAAFDGDLDRYVYSRYGNPSVTMLQNRLAALEGAEACLCMSTGMGAMFMAVASQLKSGDKIVASRALFGACYAVIDQILPKWGIERVFVDGTDLAAWEAALADGAQMVFMESPSNPVLDLVDIPAVVKLAHDAGAMVVVDNVFATQTGQSPLELGADLVMYSLTKHHDGHGRVLAGALLGSHDLINGDMLKFYRQTGPAISSFNAWVILKSLDTMALRINRQAESSMAIAAFLDGHPKMKGMRYPHHPSHPQYDLAKRQMRHGGSIVSFEVAGGQAQAFQFLNSLGLIDISNNLGDTKSLACHPATTTHSSLAKADREDMGVKDGTIRLSVGLEDPDDLIADLSAALAAV